MKRKRILILRLSSFGDIIHTLPAVDHLAQNGFDIDYLSKAEFLPALKPEPHLKNVYIFEKKSPLWTELKKVKRLIASQRYDYIYDAHNNLRSTLILFYTFFLRLRLRLFYGQAKLIRRGKSRFKRVLLFNFRIDLFKRPFVSAQSYINPLVQPQVLPPNTLASELLTPVDYKQNIDQASDWEPPLKPYICLAPSAAWPLKRWPTSHFQELIDLMPEQNFIILGGPNDDFALKLQGANVSNLVGKLSWADTGKAISHASLLISADTGVLHWADYMHVPCLGLLGPTAFGTPFRLSSKVLNLNLPCSPCTKDGRGSCKIAETQKCLKAITPFFVKSEVLKFI